MGVGVVVVVVMALALAGPAVAGQREAEAAFKTGLAAAQNKDCKTALRLVSEQIGARGFGDLSVQGRLSLYGLGFTCAWQDNQVDLALRYVQGETAIPGANADMWRARFALAWQTRDMSDAVTALEHLGQAFPEALNAMPITTWYGFVRQSKASPTCIRAC